MTILRFRLIAALGILVLLLAACASGTSDTTANTEEPTTTTAAAEEPTTTATEETTDPGTVGSLSDMPQACLDAFDTFLRDIEPIVADFDFENATQADLEEIGVLLEEVSLPLEEATANCPDLAMEDEESMQLMIDYARDVAPGTVPYFEWIASFAAASGSQASGDCETDIDALMEFVDAGTPMSGLTMSEISTVSGLLTSISTNCSPERFNEVISDPAVQEFTGS
jgi:hypothetical protein